MIVLCSLSLYSVLASHSLTIFCTLAPRVQGLPSKHARSDLHPGRIGWEALAKSGLDDSCTMACFRTGSVWPKPGTVSQNSSGSGLVLYNNYYPGRLWKNGTESENGETGSGPVASCQKPGQVIPAHRLAFRPEEFSQTVVRPSRSDQGRFCAVWRMPSLEKWN